MARKVAVYRAYKPSWGDCVIPGIDKAAPKNVKELEAQLTGKPYDDLAYGEWLAARPLAEQRAIFGNSKIGKENLKKFRAGELIISRPPPQAPKTLTQLSKNALADEVATILPDGEAWDSLPKGYAKIKTLTTQEQIKLTDKQFYAVIEQMRARLETKKPTEKVKRALDFYTGKGHKLFNLARREFGTFGNYLDSIRKRDPSRDLSQYSAQKTIERDLVPFIEQSSLKESVVVWRGFGIKSLDARIEGGIYSDPTLTSTSLSKDIGQSFLAGTDVKRAKILADNPNADVGEFVLQKIRIPKNTKGASFVAPYNSDAFISGEQEIILAPSAQLRLVKDHGLQKIGNETNIRVLEFEMVANP